MPTSWLHVALIGILLASANGQDPCDPNPCLGGGDCSASTCREIDNTAAVPAEADHYICECEPNCRLVPGASPQMCELKPCAAVVNPCDPGICIDTFDDFFCKCPEGYSGSGTTSCTDTDECAAATNPCCKGTCTDGLDPVPGYTCSCPAGTKCYHTGAPGKGPGGTPCTGLNAKCVEDFGPDGRYYAGSLDHTENQPSKTCIPWSMCSAYNDASYFVDGVVPGAVCRNPDNHGRYPNQYEDCLWCYTNANCGEWGYCKIQLPCNGC